MEILTILIGTGTLCVEFSPVRSPFYTGGLKENFPRLSPKMFPGFCGYFLWKHSKISRISREYLPVYLPHTACSEGSKHYGCVSQLGEKEKLSKLQRRQKSWPSLISSCLIICIVNPTLLNFKFHI